MATVAPALLYALFIWWFSTGLALLIVLRLSPRLALTGVAITAPLSLLLLGWSSARTDLIGAYAAFTAAILLWGTQELAFLTGMVTGPTPRALPDGARGLARFRAALQAILYHEIALIAGGLVVLAITAGAANQTGALTYLVLWLMRVSAKLNLFLGVPVTNSSALPPRISFLASYFRAGPVNGFFPLAVILAFGGLAVLAIDAARPDIGPAEQASVALVAGLMGLAILEHLFMLLPLPIDRLWAWSTRGARKNAAETPHDPPSERVAVTVP